LTAIVSNGTPPYKYQWIPIPGNTATLNDATAANPIIDTATAPYVAFYRLAVYDASTPQKEASRQIKIQLQTDDTYDLAMRDSYVDMLDEANSQGNVDTLEWTNIFSSPDIWNRQYDDHDTVPQVVQYFLSGNPNYMQVRVRNVGCADYSQSGNNAFLRAYWTLASTGENWSADWTTTQVVGSGGIMVPAGGEITPVSPSPFLYIPLMHPGDQNIFDIPWNPVDPTQYAGSPANVDVCFLGRIEEPYKTNLGIYGGEIPHVSVNVRNSNNIVTRNTSEVNLGHWSAPPPGPLPFDTHRVYVGNASSAVQVFSLQMLTDRDIHKHFAGNLSEYMYVTVKMDPNLFTAWANGGYYGTYASMDQENNTVTYDPSTPLRLDSITLDSGTHYYADLTFTLRDNITIAVPAIQKIHFQQLYNNNGHECTYGEVSYRVHIEDTTAEKNNNGQRQSPKPIVKTESSNYYTVYPNPAYDVLYISWLGDKQSSVNVTILDMTGRLIIRQDNVIMQNGTPAQINIENLVPGMYLINLQDVNGFRKTYKISKVE